MRFEEPMGQWRALEKLVQRSTWPRPSKLTVLRAWWHSRRYLGIFEAWRFVGAMEAMA